MTQKQITAEALALFRRLSQGEQTTYLLHLRSLLVGPRPAPADPV